MAAAGKAGIRGQRGSSKFLSVCCAPSCPSFVRSSEPPKSRWSVRLTYPTIGGTARGTSNHFESLANAPDAAQVRGTKACPTIVFTTSVQVRTRLSDWRNSKWTMTKPHCGARLTDSIFFLSSCGSRNGSSPGLSLRPKGRSRHANGAFPEAPSVNRDRGRHASTISKTR